MSTYWNRVFKLPPVDMCQWMKIADHSNSFPIMQYLFKTYTEEFPNLPQSCPIKPGKYQELNRTFTTPGYIVLPNNPVMSKFLFPNGRYRVDIRVSSKNSTIYGLLIMEVRNRLGDDQI
jgi:Protein of unknown function (DUF1091)